MEYFFLQPRIFGFRSFSIMGGILLLSCFWLSAPTVFAQDQPSPPATEEVSESAPESEEAMPQLVTPEEISPELGKETEAEKNLNDLLAVPFDQLKKESDKEEHVNLSAYGDDESDKKEDVVEDPKEELPEPTGAQQSLVEKMLEVKITEMMKEIMPQEFVGVTVSIKYFIETVPVSKNKKQIKKIKLPGFENHVWVPTKTKQIVGIVNQTRTYTTLFIVVSKPVSPFNIEVLRQTLSERLEQIDLLKDDVLKVVYVPHAASNLTGEEKIDQLALLETKGLIPKKVEGPEESAEEGIPKKKKKPEKIEEDIDMLMKMETTRYLLRAREAYQRDDYDSAITSISEAIDVNPFSPQAYEMLGSIYYRLGWNGMALENWQRALRLEPDNDMLRKYIARLER